MKVRKITIEDIETVKETYAYAREFMKRSGNPNQWGDTKPLIEETLKDIENGNLYAVTDEEGAICGVFAFLTEKDPTYAVIEDGAWLNDGEYGVIHRIASNGRIKNMMGYALNYCEQKVPNVRIDTHHDNKVMQHILEKNGYAKCGIIHLENGDPRIAYQKQTILGRVKINIETERLVLRPWEESDAEDCYYHCKNPVIGDNTGFRAHCSVGESRDVIKNVLSVPGVVAVVLKETGRVIGSGGLSLGRYGRLPENENQAEIGYWIGADYWGHGYATEVTEALLEYGFAGLNLEKIWCGYFEGNDRSRNVQKKTGFRYVETIEIEWPAFGRNVIEAVNCITKEEWEDRISRKCPCCGRHVFTEKNAFEICPVCGWEDDRIQRGDPDYAGGANGMSLNEAKRKYFNAGKDKS